MRTKNTPMAGMRPSISSSWCPPYSSSSNLCRMECRVTQIHLNLLLCYVESALSALPALYCM